MQSVETTNITWQVDAPIFLPGPPGTFDEVAVKDPSIVFYEDMWHLFYTARGKEEYTTGYVSAPTFEELQSAQRHELPMIRGKTRYGCAPQVFFFEPQQTWYLIFQNRDTNYQPVFSTTKTIADPESWTNPIPLLTKDTTAKWIDFWVMCDREKAYMFYTEAHDNVVVRSTRLEDFPNGWGKAVSVLEDIHEAVHVYKVKDQETYHMIYELNEDGVRSFGLATAGNLLGPWSKVTDQYATGAQLRYPPDSGVWTEMVSHGEVVRFGYNQLMEYEPERCRWLIQGMRKEHMQGPYPSLTWTLGIIQKADEE